MNKQPLKTVLAGILMSTGALAQASTIAFSGEIHTGNSELSIHNMSDSGITIQTVTVTLGDNAVFSLTPTAEVSTTITVDHWNDASIIDDPADYTTATALETGYVGPVTSDITEGASSATFDFTDFDSGEAWGILVDYDTAFGVEDTPGGNHLNNTLIEVTFTDGYITETLGFQYSVGGGTGKKSFPTDPIPFNANSTLGENVSPVPVPAAIWLFASGLIGLASVARPRRM